MEMSMRRLVGIGACDGLALGRVRLLEPRIVVTERRVTQESVAAELARLEGAVDSTAQQLALLSRQLEAQQLDEGQAIIDAHRLMLGSDRLLAGVRSLIRSDGLAVEAAVQRVVGRIAAVFTR